MAPVRLAVSTISSRRLVDQLVVERLQADADLLL
jgi:hypothetical protein